MAAADVRIFPALKELSESAAERISEIAEGAAAQGKNAAVALSGGGTPRALYELLSTGRFARRIPWDRLQIFQVDERAVPPDDAQSNYRMIRQALLDRVPEAAAHFHRIAAERQDLESAANEYAEEIRAELSPSRNGWPRFDLILLGMGDDGHTASLFPSTHALDEAGRVVVPNFVPRLGVSRVTLTFPVLNAAAEVIFLVAGAKKAPRLKDVIEGPPGSCPAQRVRPVSGRLSWYVDEAAAELLSGRQRKGS